MVNKTKYKQVKKIVDWVTREIHHPRTEEGQCPNVTLTSKLFENKNKSIINVIKNVKWIRNNLSGLNFMTFILRNKVKKSCSHRKIFKVCLIFFNIMHE